MTGAVLFDLDGTLVDPRDGILACLRAALDAVAIPHKAFSDDQLVRHIGIPLPALLAQCGVPPEQSLLAIESFQQHFATNGPAASAPHPGIVELIDELGAQGVRLAVATSKPVAAAEAVLGHHGLLERFAVVAGARPDESGATKSEVIASTLVALKHNGFVTSPDPVIMVGDRAEDVAGARANGVDAVAVTWGFGTRIELANARPRWWAESVVELHQLLLAEL